MAETAGCALVPGGSRARTDRGKSNESSRRRACALVFALTTALIVTLTAGPAYAKQPDPSDKDNFEVYEGTVTPKQLDELRKAGVDAKDITQETDGSATKVETVLTERQAARLAAKGVKLGVKRIDGKAASEVLREQAAAGWTPTAPTASPAASATRSRPSPPASRG